VRRGQRHTKESHKKLSESHKGQIPWNKGKACGPRSDKVRHKISESMKGIVHLSENEGYQTLVVWEHELEDEEKLMGRLYEVVEGWT